MVITWSTIQPLRLTLSSIRVRPLCKTEIFDKSLNHATVVFWCSYTAILFVVCTLSFLWPVQIQSEYTRVEMCFCGWMNIALTHFFIFFLLLTHFWLVTENRGWIFIDALQGLELSLFSSGWSILCSLAVWSPKAISFTGLITSAARCDKSWLKPHHFCCLCPWQGDTDDAVRRRRTPLGIVWCRVSMFSSPSVPSSVAMSCDFVPWVSCLTSAVKESHINSGSFIHWLYIETEVLNRCLCLIAISCLISGPQLPVP